MSSNVCSVLWMLESADVSLCSLQMTLRPVQGPALKSLKQSQHRSQLLSISLSFCFHCLEGMCAYWTCCTALRCDGICKYWAGPWNLSFHTCAGTLWQLRSARLKTLSAWNHYKLIIDSQIRKTEITKDSRRQGSSSGFSPQRHWEDKPTGRGTEACANWLWRDEHRVTSMLCGFLYWILRGD